MGDHDGIKCCPCAEALAIELDLAEQALRNLVAVIDRDGGHAQRGESVTASGERAKAVVFAERSAMRNQRDEARALVRRYVEGDCLYDELNEEQACNAILRWDEEAKRNA